MSQISKFFNAPYGLCIHFLVWPHMTSRGFQRPNTSFLLKLIKLQLKRLPTRESQINYYFEISILILHFFVKFKIQSDSVGWQGRQAVLQKTTPTESYCFLKIVELYNFMYQIKWVMINCLKFVCSKNLLDTILLLLDSIRAIIIFLVNWSTAVLYLLSCRINWIRAIDIIIVNCLNCRPLNILTVDTNIKTYINFARIAINRQIFCFKNMYGRN